jgi:outer membrane cobalamin receptor
VGTSFRAPTFNELYWEDAWSKGNPQLRPETANNYEVGINSSIGHSANLALAYFCRDTKNLIGWRPQDASNPYGIWEVANTASALIKGVEGTWSQQLGNHLTWQMGYTVLDARNQYGAKLEQVAPQQGNLNLTYQNSGFTARFDVKTKLDAPLLPGYTVSDLAVEQALLPGIKLTFQVRNLLNEEYAEQIGYPAAPRTYGVGARITF